MSIQIYKPNKSNTGFGFSFSKNAEGRTLDNSNIRIDLGFFGIGTLDFPLKISFDKISPKLGFFVI